MSLIGVLITLVVLGLVWYVLRTLMPDLDPTIAKLIHVVIVVAAVLVVLYWLLGITGYSGIATRPVGPGF